MCPFSRIKTFWITFFIICFIFYTYISISDSYQKHQFKLYFKRLHFFVRLFAMYSVSFYILFYLKHEEKEKNRRILLLCVTMTSTPKNWPISIWEKCSLRHLWAFISIYEPAVPFVPFYYYFFIFCHLYTILLRCLTVDSDESLFFFWYEKKLEKM